MLQIKATDIFSILNRERSWVMHARRVVQGMAHLGFMETKGQHLSIEMVRFWEQTKPEDRETIDWLYEIGIH